MPMRLFRRLILGGGIEIDITNIPDTQKLYYKATARVTPRKDSLGSKVIVNKWDSTTGEGVIVCEKEITSILENAFYGHTKITSVTIPNSVTTIGERAFDNCSELTSVTIANGVTTIKAYAFSNCDGLINISIPDSVTMLERSVFSMSDNLKSVVIGTGVKTIPSSCFYYCTSLSDITIGGDVTSIEEDAFCKCTSLTSITIPDSVTKIKKSAFYYCTSMQYYDFSTHESIPTLTNTAVFGSLPSTCKIIVPDALYDEWIAATNWSTYASYIIKKSDWDASQTTE